MRNEPYIARTSGPVAVFVTSHTGQVNVTVDPRATQARIVVGTPDTTGANVEAVQGTTITEINGLVQVAVPQPARTNVFSSSGSVYNFRGNVTGSAFSVGGNGNSNYVFHNGGPANFVSTEAGSPITVDVVVPASSSIQLFTTSASLHATGGVLEVLEARTQSGAISATHVAELRVFTVSGAIHADRVDRRVEIDSTSGAISIGAWHGSSFRARNVSGPVTARAMPEARGRMNATTVSGDIDITGADHLAVGARTVSGRIR